MSEIHFEVEGKKYISWKQNLTLKYRPASFWCSLCFQIQRFPLQLSAIDRLYEVAWIFSTISESWWMWRSEEADGISTGVAHPILNQTYFSKEPNSIEPRKLISSKLSSSAFLNSICFSTSEISQEEEMENSVESRFSRNRWIFCEASSWGSGSSGKLRLLCCWEIGTSSRVALA